MSAPQTLPCPSCAASLEFKPGSTQLKCPYCGYEQAIAPPQVGALQELDFESFRYKASMDASLEQEKVLHCNSCAAEFTLGTHTESGECPFCGSKVVVPADPETRIPPGGVLPFQINARTARDSYRKWIGSRFWAPNDLKKRAEQESTLHAMYVPYWTYDSFTVCPYTGMRGIDYQETETYYENGQARTRTVTKTRWYPAAGTVEVAFDDVLVMATETLPRQYTQHMQSWDLSAVAEYQTSYLSGFQAMRYDIDLVKGFGIAEGQMRPRIESEIRRDIGGDRQQITGYQINHYNVTFKHLLLPIYSGAYRYKGKIWRFFVNGQTGNVAGEAPVSFWKVLIAVILGLILVGGIVYLMSQGESSSGSSSTSISGSIAVN